MNSTDVLLCMWAKWAKKYEIILVLPSQILIYFCVGEQSKQKISNSSCFTKSNPNIFLFGQAKQAKKIQIKKSNELPVVKFKSKNVK